MSMVLFLLQPISLCSNHDDKSQFPLKALVLDMTPIHAVKDEKGPPGFEVLGLPPGLNRKPQEWCDDVSDTLCVCF